MLLVIAVVRQSDLGRIVLDLVAPGSAGLSAEWGMVGWFRPDVMTSELRFRHSRASLCVPHQRKYVLVSRSDSS